jgi:CDP-diacylglycerol---glycerol-3-phosphate 3-phosphatidyltransferase
MSLPNVITLARLFGCMLFAALFLCGDRIAALSLYVSLELLDQADGKIAKAWSLTTRTGAVFDPFVDSMTHLTAFLCLLSIGLVPPWAFLIFLFREFGLMFVRLLAGQQGLSLSGAWPGKAKALVHAVVVPILLCDHAGVVRLRVSLALWVHLAAGASVLSGLLYLRHYRAVLRRAFLQAT